MQTVEDRHADVDEGDVDAGVATHGVEELPAVGGLGRDLDVGLGPQDRAFDAGSSPARAFPGG
ncbi:hypothetical protein AB0869_28000 [Micromonospora vinacea]|uniref:hypothetical protein n=1 Tax=Micromonospora vinacea TaxID=709878 RepID=UPI003451FB94